LTMHTAQRTSATGTLHPGSSQQQFSTFALVCIDMLHICIVAMHLH